MSRHPETGLTFSRRFLPLFTLFQLGTFNDNALKNALIALITFGGLAFLSDLPSDIRVPVAALIFTGPFTLVSAIAGQIADKVDRGVILRWIKRVEIGIMLLAALGFALMDVRILAVALGLMGAQSAFFSPTKNAVLPQWLTESELIRGNALMSGVQFATILVATIFGLTVLALGPKIIAGMLVVIAIAGWLASEACPPAPPPQSGVRAKGRNLFWAAVQIPIIITLILVIAKYFPTGGWAITIFVLTVILPFICLMLGVGWMANGGALIRTENEKNPDTNFETVSATIQVVAKAVKYPDVLRPLLGISWFYAVSTVFVTTLPDLVGQTMGYDAVALQILLAASTISILIGALIVFMLGRLSIWGPEAVRLSTLGVIGVTLCTLALVLIPGPRYMGAEDFGPVAAFLDDPATPLFIIVLCGASVFNGMFIVPLQAMAQRRAEPNIHAQLMSAGSVLINLFVNLTTLSLIILAARKFGPTVPFWLIIFGSSCVSAYAIYRSIKLVERPHPGTA